MKINRNSTKEEIRKYLEDNSDFRFGKGIDFHATRLSDRSLLLDVAKAKGYKHTDTGGSLTRYFYEYLEKP